MTDRETGHAQASRHDNLRDRVVAVLVDALVQEFTDSATGTVCFETAAIVDAGVAVIATMAATSVATETPAMREAFADSMRALILDRVTEARTTWRTEGPPFVNIVVPPRESFS